MLPLASQIALVTQHSRQIYFIVGRELLLLLDEHGHVDRKISNLAHLLPC